eukprot:3526261-Pyramimonas_sp.AAC.1
MGQGRHWSLRRSSVWGHETLYWVEKHMRTPPLGPSVELPLGPRNAVLGGGDACECRASGGAPFMEPRNAVLGRGNACEHHH